MVLLLDVVQFKIDLLRVNIGKEQKVNKK